MNVTTSGVRSCDIQLSPSPISSDNSHAFIDCVPFPAAAPDGELAWYFDFTETPAHLQLGDEVCSAMMTTGARAIDIYTDCPNQ